MAVIAGIPDVLVGASDLNVLVDGITGAVVCDVLSWITNSEVLLILAAIKLHEGHAVTSIEARMLSGAELVILVDNPVKLRSEGLKGHGELSLLLLHVHEQAEEGWNQVVFASRKQLGVHLALKLQPCLLSDLGRVIFFFLFAFLLLFLILDLRHGAILGDAELFAGALRQSERLEHFLERVLEFCAWTARPSKRLLKLRSFLLDGGFICAVLKLLTR